MALAHLGIARSQAELARILQVRPGFGAPASNILNLRSRRIEATYHTNGVWDDLHAWLQRQVPVIVCVQAGELPHWKGAQAQHAGVIVGLDEDNVHFHDPALDRTGPPDRPPADCPWPHPSPARLDGVALCCPGQQKLPKYLREL